MAQDTETKARTVKLPANLWEKLKDMAEKEHRTINGQIAALVEKANA